MALISLPYTFTVGAVIIAAQHNSNFSIIYNDYNGNITDANISASANISQSKIALNLGTAANNIVQLNSSAYIPSISQVGVSTNSNAATGNIGEYVESIIASGSKVTLGGTGISTNVTSISLTAGDWDVTGLVALTDAGGVSYTYALTGINTVSATIPASSTSYPYFGVTQTSFTNSVDYIMNLTTGRFSLSATTTVYLIARAAYSGGNSYSYGYIRARRMR